MDHCDRRQPTGGTPLWSELVCEAELEDVLHQPQLISDVERARGGRTTGASPPVGEVEGTAIADREISEIGIAILRARHPTGPEPQVDADASGPAQLGARMSDVIRPERSAEIIANGAVRDVR